jgi:hypothetical protein
MITNNDKYHCAVLESEQSSWRLEPVVQQQSQELSECSGFAPLLYIAATAGMLYCHKINIRFTNIVIRWP